MPDVQVGEFYLNKNEWIRKIIAVKDSMVLYREYDENSEDADDVIRGSCLQKSLKSWGKLIAPRYARFLVSQIEELDAEVDKVEANLPVDQAYIYPNRNRSFY